MAPSLSSNAKTFSIYAKKLPKSFGGSDFCRTFASAFAQKAELRQTRKSSLKELHKQRRK